MALSTRVAVTSSRRRGCALLVLVVALALFSREARGGPWQVAERRPCASPVSALRPAARLPPRCLELRGGAGPECETEDAAGLAHDMAKLSTDQAGGEKRENVNLVMVGHVDAGKSTICGHLLYLSGQLDQRTMDKFIRESEALGRSSWKFAWAMDLTEEERAKGKTQEVGQAHIETEKRRYTLLDAPGHKNYVPNMIGGATQAEVAILVISARRGEFEAGFERGGQTREHAVLVRSGGARHIVVAVNKMDECEWASARFEAIQSRVSPFLKSLGFDLKTDVSWIPIAGLGGENLRTALPAGVCPWYQGPPLMDLLDGIELPRRYSDRPLRILVSSAYREGEVFALGKVESGKVDVGRDLVLMPGAKGVKVLQILVDDDDFPTAEAGDIVRLKVSMAKGYGEDDVTPGSVLCEAGPGACGSVTRFCARVNVLEAPRILSAGYSCMLHVHSIVTSCEWKEVKQVLDKTTKKFKKAPFARAGTTCDVEIEVPEEICVEKYKDFPQLGRFVLREEGLTVGIGVVTSFGES